jgi:hypothetical protein
MLTKTIYTETKSSGRRRTRGVKLDGQTARSLAATYRFLREQGTPAWCARMALVHAAQDGQLSVERAISAVVR